jgi:hypothetical protein
MEKDKFYIDSKNQAIDKKELHRLIVAFTLGDGSLRLQKKTRCMNASYYSNMIAKSLDYLLHQAYYLRHLTTIRVNYFPAFIGKNDRHNKHQIKISTMTHPVFTNIYSRLYGTGRKALTYHDLTHFNEHSLACLIQDDGTIDIDKQYPYYYRTYICTESFTEQDNYLLRDTIASKTGIHSDVKKIKRNGKYIYRLHFSYKQSILLRECILPFVAPSFYYKMNLCPTLQTVHSWYEKYIKPYQEYDIVRTLLKDSEYYRNVIPSTL